MRLTKQQGNTRPIEFPLIAVENSGLISWENVQFFNAPGVLVLSKGAPTAMELVNIIDALTDHVAELVAKLVDACGICDACGEGCDRPAEEVSRCELCDNCLDDSRQIHIPDCVLEEAGIPVNAKLEAYPGENGEITVVPVCYDHDISDVPVSLRLMLSNLGVCLAELDNMLMRDETITN